MSIKRNFLFFILKTHIDRFIRSNLIEVLVEGMQQMKNCVHSFPYPRLER